MPTSSHANSIIPSSQSERIRDPNPTSHSCTRLWLCSPVVSSHVCSDGSTCSDVETWKRDESTVKTSISRDESDANRFFAASHDSVSTVSPVSPVSPFGGWSGG